MKTLLKIARFIVAATFIILAIFAFSQKSIIGGLLFLAGGILIIPLGISKKIREKLKLDKTISIILSIIFLFAGVFATPTDEIKTDTHDASSVSQTVYNSKNESTATSSDNETETESQTETESNEDLISTESTIFSESSNEENAQTSDTPTSSSNNKFASSANSSSTKTPAKNAEQVEKSTNNETDNNQTVYITQTGKKYHSSKNCSGLANAKAIYETSLSNAKTSGLEPCAKCH